MWWSVEIFNEDGKNSWFSSSGLLTWTKGFLKILMAGFVLSAFSSFWPILCLGREKKTCYKMLWESLLFMWVSLFNKSAIFGNRYLIKHWGKQSVLKVRPKIMSQQLSSAIQAWDFNKEEHKKHSKIHRMSRYHVNIEKTWKFHF